ncbi:5'/3'-nucleotidase SurE [Tumebacillus sp. DT12]|uniref:5'-nucleotidase SurE n=1 Tax=Tumebacillus lacus TaxID=2995335 RepID=A0ABT3WVK8_9BACL|nr:5'/3'-nucleotidase SurE [Tumebacillus lacus]MCX7568712.1 5'/3'-nucleotidase SurE [Tumebacillus lacus]
MKILISNDDGVLAPGIAAVAASLQTIGEVFVVAPDRQRSAAGHGITLHKPLYVDEKTLPNGIRAYGVSGTPADCVKFGIDQIMGPANKPDIVVSGINAGPNLGSDVMYSGTVSAAIEGAIQGIPSIAVSLCGHAPYDFTHAATFTATLVQEVMKNGLLADTVLNVNVPALKEGQTIQGTRITTLGTRRYHNEYDKRVNPRGVDYYWLAGELMDLHPEQGSDIEAIKEKHISVSPLHFDFTNRKLIDALKGWTLD